MNKSVQAILALVMFASISHSQTVSDAMRALHNEQPGKAKSILLQLVAKNPVDAEAAYRLGNLYYQSGQKDSARIYYEKGMKPEDKVNYNLAGLGKLLLDEKNKAKAQEDFDKLSVFGKSKDSKAFTFIGEAWFNSSEKNPEKAIAALERAVELNIKNAEAHLLLGDIYLEMNNAGKAITSYEYAGDAEPKMALAYLKTGQIFMKTGTYDVALDNFKKAHEADSLFAPAYRELGEFHYRAKNYDEAVRLYKKYIDLTGEDLAKLSRYASFLFLNKDYSQSTAIIENIMKRDSSNFILSRLIGYSYFEQEKYAEGLAYMKKFFAKADTSKIIGSDYAYYGKLLAKTGNDSLAVVYLNKAISSEPNNADLIEDLAFVFYTQKKYPEAAEEYEKMLKLKRGNSQDYFQLGKTYYYYKDYVYADSAFLKVTELQPASPIGYLWRARCASMLDPESEKGLALPHYLKFKELATDETKFKKELVEAYSYLGYYHFLKNEMAASKQDWQKVKILDPANTKAKEFLKQN